jgi:small subunit ribosomal protein S17
MSDTTQQSESAASEHESVGRGSRRRLQGRIVSDTHKPGRAKKTVVVELQRRYRDQVYGKYVKSRKRYHAHDEKEQFRTNDIVEIEESRPLSATKRWVTIRLVSRPVEV